jgi:hypothetical protein
VFSGQIGDVPYIEFNRDGVYSVIIRGDDWRKIYPFFRYSSDAYRPVTPPLNEPPPIPAPQPNRVMPPPPVNPAQGFRSFLEGFAFDEYSKIQRLLTTFNVPSVDRPTRPYRPTRSQEVPPSLIPPEHKTDSDALYETEVYNKLVEVLQQLFPTDFPTRF